MIEIKNINFRYNSLMEQLSEVSQDIKKGEVIVITGASGCGKTTLTRVVNGLIPHFYEGEIGGDLYLKGQNAEALSPWDFGKYVGSVFQDPKSQFFTEVVEDEIAFCCENYGMPSEEIDKRLRKVSKNLKIDHLLLRRLQTLSSGEKQKVAIASVAAMDPEIYVMDEPSANLDIAATDVLAAVLRKFKEAGKTILIAEHRLYYLMDIADRILYMADGRICGTYTAHQMCALSDQALSQMGLRATKIDRCAEACLTPSPSVSAKAPIVSVEGLWLKIGKGAVPLLSDITFEINSGEILALTGPNGAGKTTLARSLCGLVGETSGKISFCGGTVKPRARYKHAWFMMQDADCQLFSESVLEEMMVGKKKTPVLQKKVEAILTELDLWQCRERHPASLSGGQKQRLTLAVAMIQETELLILDEPTSGLDGKNLEKVVGCIKKQAERGKAILIITHDHELVQKACGRMLFLEDGRLSDNPMEKFLE